MALTQCIACRKEVEETIPACPYCGTVSPKRIMLVPCRICGENVGKNAHRCPHCTSPTPYKKKFLREYLLLIPPILMAYYLFNVGKPESSVILYEVTTFAVWFLIWFYFQKLKDCTGLMKLFPIFFPGDKGFPVTSCLKCKLKYSLYKTETCPNCGEPAPKNI